MKDTATQKALYVSTDGIAGSYIMVPVSQLDTVKRLLDGHRIPYSVDEIAVSLDDEPEVAFINLRRGADAKVVQQLLDSVT